MTVTVEPPLEEVEELEPPPDPPLVVPLLEVPPPAGLPLTSGVVAEPESAR